MTEPNDRHDPPRAGRDAARRRRRWLLWAGIPSLALAGAFVGRAFAHGGFGRCGFHHHGRAQSAEELEQRMAYMAEKILGRVDATDTQVADVRAILARRAPELHALQREGRQLRTALLDAAQQDDRETLEGVRKRGLATMDRGSALWLETLHELTDVLTDAQRRELMDHLRHFGRH